MQTLKRLLKYKLIGAGILLGALGGYAYYHFIGCSSGSCAITSNPVNSTLYGAFLGGILFDLFRKPKPENNNKQ